MPSLNFSMLSPTFFLFFEELKEPSTGKKRKKRDKRSGRDSGVEVEDERSLSYSKKDNPYISLSTFFPSNPSLVVWLESL